MSIQNLRADVLPTRVIWSKSRWSITASWPEFQIDTPFRNG